MSETFSDRIGGLSLVISVPRDFEVVRLFCYSCMRECPAGHERDYSVGKDYLRGALMGSTMYLKYVGEQHIGLILPFDPLGPLRHHLLHEIRPEVDRRWIGRPVVVQDLTSFDKFPLGEKGR